MKTLNRTAARTLAVLAAAGLALAPSAAFAADGSITHVETKPGTIQVLVSVPADADVDLGGVKVTVDGKAAKASAEPAESDTDVQRTAVLVIDTSKSMEGDRFEAAKNAAREFITTVPANVAVGIVSFSSEVTTDLAPTTDRAAATAVLDQLQLAKKTRLYDGVIQGVDVAGSEGQRSLLVLSDGADHSSTPIENVTTAIKDADVLADVVAIEHSGPRADIAALQQIATAGTGQVISTDPAALQAAFAAEATVLADQVLVTATLPSGFDKSSATIKVTLPAKGGAITAEAFSTVEPATPEVAAKRAWTPPSWAIYAGPFAIALGVIFLAVLMVPRKHAVSAADRVTQYTEGQAGGAQSQSAGFMDTDITFASAKETAANVLRRNKDLDVRISSRLQAAGSELKSSEWLLLHGALFFIAGLSGLLLG